MTTYCIFEDPPIAGHTVHITRAHHFWTAYRTCYVEQLHLPPMASDANQIRDKNKFF